MFREKVPGLQLAAWLLAAMTAPLIQLAGKDGWVAALVAGVVCCLLCLAVNFLPTENLFQRKWFCALEYLSIVLVLSEMLRWSESSWPTGGTLPVVPITLLVLASMSALSGTAYASRTGGMLFWILAVLYGIILVSGVKDIKVEYLAPVWRIPSAGAVLVLLLPSAAIFLPKKENRLAVFPVISLFFLAVSLLTVGTLSQSVSSDAPWPFYEFSKSLNLFGIARRIEAFVSVASTVGYFALYSFLLSCAGYLADAGWGRGRVGVAAAAVISGALLGLPGLHPCVAPLCILFLWIFVPGVRTFGCLVGEKNKM